MRSSGDTSSAGEAMGLPLTATRPAAIQASASRREQSPARAITLAMRSPDLDCGAFLLAMTVFRHGRGCFTSAKLGNGGAAQSLPLLEEGRNLRHRRA